MNKALRRELIILAATLALTVFAVVPLTYVVGSKTLGEYAGGGSFGRYLADLTGSLAGGDAAMWFFMLSPLLALCIVRVGWRAFKMLSQRTQQSVNEARD
ncbi:MAG: hypothetical protein AAGA84_10250 [Pseudomonadota bacterium]